MGNTLKPRNFGNFRVTSISVHANENRSKFYDIKGVIRSLDSSDAIQIIVLILLLLLSGFFSSAETSLTTVSKIKMRALADDGNQTCRSRT